MDALASKAWADASIEELRWAVGRLKEKAESDDGQLVIGTSNLEVILEFAERCCQFCPIALEIEVVQITSWSRINPAILRFYEERKYESFHVLKLFTQKQSTLLKCTLISCSGIQLLIERIVWYSSLRSIYVSQFPPDLIFVDYRIPLFLQMRCVGRRCAICSPSSSVVPSAVRKSARSGREE